MNKISSETAATAALFAQLPIESQDAILDLMRTLVSDNNHEQQTEQIA